MSAEKNSEFCSCGYLKVICSTELELPGERKPDFDDSKIFDQKYQDTIAWSLISPSLLKKSTKFKKLNKKRQEEILKLIGINNYCMMCPNCNLKEVIVPGTVFCQQAKTADNKKNIQISGDLTLPFTNKKLCNKCKQTYHYVELEKNGVNFYCRNCLT